MHQLVPMKYAMYYKKKKMLLATKVDQFFKIISCKNVSDKLSVI